MRSLYTKLCSADHLRTAWKAINKSNRGSHGIDNVSIEQFKNDLDREIALISKQLRSRTYVFHKFRGKTIPKPGSTDLRPIQIPAVRDRVVMKALSLLIAPKLKALKEFDMPCSFAYIENRSIHGAIELVHQFAKAGNTFVAEADIYNFFGAVDQERLLKRLHSVLRYKSLKSILDSAIQNEIGNRSTFALEHQNLFPASDSGIPQGGVLSPMLANLYLSSFDAALTRKGLNLVRYADDFVIMCKTRSDADAALSFSRKFLKSRLGLELKESKTRVVDYRGGFDFLGFRVEGGKHAPSQKKINGLKAKISSLSDPRTGHALFPILLKIRNVLGGWYEAYRRSELGDIPRDINAHVVSEISGYLSTHKIIAPGKKLKAKQLRMLGIPSIPIR